jgi:hypothetical protein
MVRRGELQAVPARTVMPWFEAPEVENHQGTVIGACHLKVLQWVWSTQMPRPKYSLSKVTSSTFYPACICNACEERKPSGRYLDPGVPIPPGQEWIIARSPEPLKPFEPLQPFKRPNGLPRDALDQRLREDALPVGSPRDALRDEDGADTMMAEDFEQDATDKMETGTTVGDFEEFPEVEMPEADDGQRAAKWNSEQYAVKQSVINDIKMRLRVAPTVDCFASNENHRFPVWWGPGSDVVDAFDQDWRPQGDRVLWMNPPFSQLPAVIAKTAKDQARAVLVCPDWRSEQWWRDVQPFVVRRYHYKAGKKIFEMPDVDVGVTKWGVWAYLLDGSRQPADYEGELLHPEKTYSVAELDDTWTDTVSSKRRKRQRAQGQGKS